MTTTTSPSLSFRLPGNTTSAFSVLAQEARELAKALLQPGKFVAEVEQMRAKQVQVKSV